MTRNVLLFSYGPLIVLQACLAVTLSLPTFAQTDFATLEAHRGQVSVVRRGSALTLSRGMPLERNDTLVTRRGTAAIRFVSDGSQVRVGPESRIQIDESAGERGIEVFFGRLWARIVSFRDRQTRVRTGSTIAAVRGTEIALDFDEQQTLLWVFEGEMTAENPSGTLTVSSGQSAVAVEGSAPAMRVSVRPQDAVQWSLYYMPVLFEEVSGQEDWQQAIQESIDSYREGDLGGALDRIENVSDASIDDPRFFIHRASLYLAAGSFGDANSDIDRALALDGNNADALSLQAVIAVALNDNERALTLAERAVAADAQSASAQIALSYAQQALFDLEGARTTLENAAANHPDNALVWARLSELHLSFGELGNALDAAQTSAGQEPNLVRSQTVLGYAYLTQVRTEEAKEAFRRAIELDQGDPVPRLGLGLALIREGDLAEGRKEIEVASSLDPGNAVVRSYLGKAYFEEKRTELDEREYELANEIDPRDPTPWFYDAIAKQTTNQPVEALHNFQRAIELNDNRAIYRSRLLLDSDLAARSASLGRIFSDLGFQQLALVEGWHSANLDPSNHSAHRLLADSYAARPRHEIARVSELLQSQLLQPLNTTPIQPRLAESNLFLISAQGPAGLSFNEFNPLFNRDQVNIQANGFFGEDDTWLGEAIVSGIYDKVSFSAGYDKFSTEGFRDNADQDDEIANGFVQVQLSQKTSVQAEVRHRELETGDLELRFFEGDFRPELRERTQQTSARAGVHHAFSPSSELLFSYVYQDKEIDFFDGPDFLSGLLSLELDVDEQSNSFESQYLYRSGGAGTVGGINVTAGGGYFDIESDEVQTLEIDLPPPPFGPGPITDVLPLQFSTKHANLYAYSNITLPSDVTITLGVSGDRFDEEEGKGERNQVNPKAGLTWRAATGTTIRAAGFRALKRTLITNQTIEPTQVAGFNQFFDDPGGTSSWVYGAAIDQKIEDSYFFGFEYTRRELEIPSLEIDVQTFETRFVDRDQEEDVARLYFLATPHDWLSFSAEYELEKIEHDPMLQLGFEEVDTHRVPLGVRFFHPSGIGASVKGTYVTQDGRFELREPPFGFVPGDVDFWVVDASVRYRLPKRYGFLVVGVNNLADEDFAFLATESILPTGARNLRIRPGRVVFAQFTLAFP